MSSSNNIALLFMDGHHAMTPMALVETIALLERHGRKFTLYEPARAKESDWQEALTKTLLRIHEDIVLVAFSSENHFYAVGSLIFLSQHIDLLQNKQVHVCLPALALFQRVPFHRENVIFHKRLLNEVVSDLLIKTDTSTSIDVSSMVAVIKKYGYVGKIVSGALNADCRYRCSFCFSRNSAGGRGPNSVNRLDRIMQLIDVAQHTKAPFFKFTDPNFTDDSTGVAQFIERYKNKGRTVLWHCSARLDLLNEEIYGQMTDNGCDYILCGAEHVVRRISDSLYKGQDTIKQLSKLLSYWNQRSTISLSFMTGFKNEEPHESLENLDFIKRLRKISGLHPYLGYYILFREEQRGDCESNYLIGLIYLLYMVPYEKKLSLTYARALLKHSRENPFFDFYHCTANPQSLNIIKAIMQVFTESPDFISCMPEMKRFMTEMPEWTTTIRQSKSISEINQILI
ncbi:MAG: radical SAM protein [Candidatus Omnitrophica bacterium]|nr:radical SAM protein [Candidatus Omnitrophota bacterium]